MATKKSSAPEKGYKYEIKMHDNGGNGILTVYGNTIQEVRRKLTEERFKFNNQKYECYGFLYEMGMADPYKAGKKYWTVKDSRGTIEYDRHFHAFFYKERGTYEGKVIRANGTLGMTKSAFIRAYNKMLGL